MPKPFRKALAVVFSLLFRLNSPASIYSTIHNGAWTSPATWVNGQVPPLSGSDSIYIYHDVMYTSFLHLVTSTYVYIDTGATLCGHRKFSLLSGSVVNNHGWFYGDTLIINGGTMYNYGNETLQNAAVIGNGGSLINNGFMQIGATFLCSEESNGIDDTGRNTETLTLFPQPAQQGDKINTGTFFLTEKDRIQIFSPGGQLVMEAIPENGGFYVNNLKTGIYIIKITVKGREPHYGKLIIE